MADFYITAYNDAKAYPVVGGVLGTPLVTDINPGGICVDRYGVTWITCAWGAATGSIQSIKSGVVSSPITVGGNPFGIIVDKNNVLWVIRQDNFTITPVTNGVVGTPVVLTGGATPSWGCCDFNNDIWVVSTIATTSKLHQIRSGVLVNTFSISGTSYGICCDLTNFIWTTGQDSGVVQKIQNGTVLASVTVDSYPMGICCDLNNDIWVSCNGGYNLWHLSGGKPVGKPISLSASPAGILCDSSNNIWVISDAGKCISQIANGRLVNVIPVPSAGTLQVCFGDATGTQAAMLFGWNKPPVFAPMMLF